MIVRIAGEGQYRVPDGDQDKLNELDNAAVEAVSAGDGDRFRELWQQMLDLVCANGNELDGDELTESDIILPPRDVTLDEARAEFTGEGLIPD
ncbi:MAG: hypothetical protein QOJ07_3170 [Thermoleophilaceae bacterium]|nr:hypothetical protein [Thermoleophilaceae bacterium]